MRLALFASIAGLLQPELKSGKKKIAINWHRGQSTRTLIDKSLRLSSNLTKEISTQLNTTNIYCIATRKLRDLVFYTCKYKTREQNKTHLLNKTLCSDYGAVCQVNDGESVAIVEIEESRGSGKFCRSLMQLILA